MSPASAPPFFPNIEQAPADPILGLTEAFRQSTAPNKINLCIGIYQDDGGVNPVLRSIKQAERMWLEQENTKAYLNIAGDEAYADAVRALLFGENHSLRSDGRCVAMHTPGGSGALRLGSDFLKHHIPNTTVHCTDPTWPNHLGIFEASGLKVQSYPYYNRETHQVRFEELLSTLHTLPAGDVVLLHGCCHNPTGQDLTHAQWDILAKTFAKLPLLPFLDCAYQGLGQGLEEDVYSLRTFANEGMEFLAASSFSKNMGLYRERTGALLLTLNTAQEATRAFSQLKRIARANYSNPASHGGQVARLVLTDPTLNALWRTEVDAMRVRMKHMRTALVEGLKHHGIKNGFNHLTTQKGMFSLTGLNKAQAIALRARHHVYLTDSGRINVSALSTDNVPMVAQAIAHTLRAT